MPSERLVGQDGQVVGRARARGVPPRAANEEMVKQMMEAQAAITQGAATAPPEAAQVKLQIATQQQTNERIRQHPH